MKIHVVNHYQDMSVKAAELVAEQVKDKNDSVLGLATGSTPEGMYSRLVKMHQEEDLDFSAIRTFNLDEYLGLGPDHPQSYHFYMHQHLFHHINILQKNINIPDGKAIDAETACRDYEESIVNEGGIDFQVLGIGGNGHIGFNEPDTSLSAVTHVVELTEKTVKDNSRFFDSEEEVPRKALTMGMGPILKAKKILLLASGEGKSEAIRATVSGKITTQVPATFLQLHPKVILILDKEAAKLI